MKAILCTNGKIVGSLQIDHDSKATNNQFECPESVDYIVIFDGALAISRLRRNPNPERPKEMEWEEVEPFTDHGTYIKGNKFARMTNVCGVANCDSCDVLNSGAPNLCGPWCVKWGVYWREMRNSAANNV